MRQLSEQHVEQYLRHLRGLPFVKKAGIHLQPRSKTTASGDGTLTIKTPHSIHRFDLEIKRSPTTYAAIDAVIGARETGHPAKTPRPLMLFAPHVGRPLAEYLVGKNVNFVDAVGNCHVRIGTVFLALIQGRTAAPRAALGRGIGLSGHLVLFAILAKPELLNTSIRTLAEQAGASKTAVEHLLARLTEEGVIVRSRNRRHLQDKKTLLDRWLAGYSTLVRPRLLVGQYRTPDTDPSALERRIEQVLADVKPWGWGGGAAAIRLTEFYRGGKTILHLAEPAEATIRNLRGLPSNEGDLTVLRTPGYIAFEATVPHTVHPLLVYTELLTEGTDRARESAAMIRDRYLTWL